MADAFELPYLDDSLALFRILGEQPWSLWLDSAGCARFDVLVCAPRATLVTQGPVTTICVGGECRQSDEDPLALLRAELSRTPMLPQSSLPFFGGAVGYFGYDLARRYERLPVFAADDQQIPELAVGIYDWGVVVDHEQKRCWLTGVDASAVAAGVAYYETLSTRAGRESEYYRVTGPVVSNVGRSAYERCIDRIKDYLRAGDCYQVNFAQRFCAPASGDPIELYSVLRKQNPAPYSAYLNLPFVQLMSASPERFLRVRGRDVETCPIKGTRRRNPDPAQDARAIVELRQSEKDRAENLMIVDLLRNDLGKSCEPGSVHVPRLFEVESCIT